MEKLDEYFKEHKEEIKASIREMRYEPRPVRSVYIPKKDGWKRRLGIPTVVDTVIQQAVAQVFETIYDPAFSEHSYGFRPDRSAHDAMEEVLMHLNEGYEWVIDLDIEKYFDTVNHDRLISCIREKVNEKEVLHLIRRFLKGGIMEDGVIQKNEAGTPQGGPLSPILSNIYLDKMDKELENRGLRAVRYADDCGIFVKSEMAGKEKRAGNASQERKQSLYQKIREVTLRRKAVSREIEWTITRINQIVRGWINYFGIGSMRGFLKKFGEWLRRKIRVIYFKQWNDPLEYYLSKTQG